ncbi:MAG: DUF4234 domain-containing protein [Lachnospiraceae bacterium]|nr:DUF4234 domain-containing protein [Lachnospiraceae bacterium]
MVTRRNIVLCIVFTIITCGIYGIYWFVKLTDEANSVAETQQTASGIMAFVFTLITCGIYSFYWMYKQGCKIDEMKMRRGISSSGTGILYLVFAVFGLSIISYCLMQNELNNYA